MGFALDPDLSVDVAARILVDEAHGDGHLLEAARLRILRAASGPASEQAARTVWIACQLLAAEGDAWRATGDVRRVVLVGMPGAGKGTQGERLAEAMGVPHISMGGLIREVADQESVFAFQAQVFMGRGRLVPDSLVLELLGQRFGAEDVRTRGFVLDGFPRTIDQAVALDALLGPHRIEVVVELVVGAHTTRDRLRSRGRPDDTDDAISRRIEEFERQTIPVLYWYRPRAELWSVDGDRADDDVTLELADRMKEWVSRRRDS